MKQVADKPRVFRDRTFQFSLRVIRLIRALPRDAAAAVIARQLARSATSVGANIEEAQGSDSRRDFTRRMNIARRESREALYWLRLISESGMLDRTRMDEIIQKADEIVRILIAIVKSSRRED
ncbi:MAG: four helix bundle protein [Planctomycetota bacterium]|nr:MAG: four helix bundle protein [Planctomycetota bacterium]